MFYLVQKEQPCPSLFGEMDTKPVFNKHVMSCACHKPRRQRFLRCQIKYWKVDHLNQSWNRQNITHFLSCGIGWRCKELLYLYMDHSTGRVAQWSWRCALVPKVLGSNPAFSPKNDTCLFMVVEWSSEYFLCGPLDGKQPIYSEIRMELRILTAGDEARRIYLGPDSFLDFECYLPWRMCGNSRYAPSGEAWARGRNGSPFDVGSGDTHARGFPCSMSRLSLLRLRTFQGTRALVELRALRAGASRSRRHGLRTCVRVSPTRSTSSTADSPGGRRSK
jgi:hypothetical protein